MTCILANFESLFKRVMGYSKTLCIFGNLFTIMLYFLVIVFSFVSPESSSSCDEVLNGSYIFKLSG